MVSIRESSGGRYTFMGMSISETGNGGRESRNSTDGAVTFFDDPQLTKNNEERTTHQQDVSLMNFMWMD